jgi:hypothetical protein
MRGGGGKDLTTSEARSGRRWERRHGGFLTGPAGAVGKIGLIHGAHASAVDREKAPRTEGVNQRRKRTSANTPMARVGRAAWAGLWLRAAGEEIVQRGRLGQRLSGPQGRLGRKRRKEFLN